MCLDKRLILCSYGTTAFCKSGNFDPTSIEDIYGIKNKQLYSKKHPGCHN